jgi:hypothetical protein
MLTILIFLILWITFVVLILRFFYISSPPKKVNTIYVGLDHNEWNTVLKCIDQCVKTGLRSDAEEEERIKVGRELANQVCNHIESELK